MRTKCKILKLFNYTFKSIIFLSLKSIWSASSLAFLSSCSNLRAFRSDTIILAAASFAVLSIISAYAFFKPLISATTKCKITQNQTPTKCKQTRSNSILWWNKNPRTQIKNKKMVKFLYCGVSSTAGNGREKRRMGVLIYLVGIHPTKIFYKPKFCYNTKAKLEQKSNNKIERERKRTRCSYQNLFTT